MPTDTIKGGAYQTADGRWINANGKPIPEPKDLPSLVDPSEEEFSPLPVVTGEEEFETPEAPIAAKKPAKKKSSKAGGD